MLDFSDVARVLGTTWAEKMFLAFRQHSRHVPRLWPGTKSQARRLAGAYFTGEGDCERLACDVQRIAAHTWAKLAVGGPVATRPVAPARPPALPRVSLPSRASLPSYH